MIQMQTKNMTAVPISTVNITGLRKSMLGFSLMKDCFIASLTSSGSNNLFDRLCLDIYLLFYFMLKNSAIGPNASAGKKESAATIMITANVMIPNVPVSVLSVPALAGMYFFFARIPAIATGPIMG